MRRAHVLAFAALALGAAAAPARAETPRRSSLSWVRLEGAEACVSTQALARAVEERLGRAAFVPPSEADVSVEGRVERGKPVRGAPLFRAHLEVRDPRGALLGTRVLEAVGSCDALTRPVALALAVMIDPAAALGGKPPPAPPPPAPPPPAAPGSVVLVTQPAPAQRKRREEWRFETTAAFAVAAGLVPGLGAGLVGATALRTPLVPLSAGATLTYVFENGRSAAGAPGTTLGVSLLRVGGHLCPLELERGVFVGSLCGGAGLDVLFHRARPSASGAEASFSVDLGAVARLTARLFGPFAAGLGATLLVPLVRDDLGFADAAGFHGAFRLSPVGGVLDAGLGARIP